MQKVEDELDIVCTDVRIGGDLVIREEDAYSVYDVVNMFLTNAINITLSMPTIERVKFEHIVQNVFRDVVEESGFAVILDGVVVKVVKVDTNPFWK